MHFGERNVRGVHRYPDPASVVYPTTAPPRFRGQLTTWDGGDETPVHDHEAFVDAQGDGVTTTDAGHFHYVRGGRIIQDPSDGHTHKLTGQPSGAG